MRIVGLLAIGKRYMPVKFIHACALFVCCLFLSGCWDQQELQERGFVLAVAIDINDEPADASSLRRIESFSHSFGGNPYRMTLQVLKLGPGEAGSKDNKGGGKTYTLSNTGISMFDMVRDMRGQTSKSLWFEHIQTIVISEDAVKKFGLNKLIDFFQRDGEMRWRTRVYVTSGKAKDFLEFQPPTGEPGGIYLAGISRQGTKNAHIAGARTDLGFSTATLDIGGYPILPRIELEKNKVKINGLALFKQDKFVGYMDEYAVKGLKFIRGTEISALILFECPEHPGEFALFELFRHQTRLTPHIEKESIYFTLDIAMRGNLGEISCSAEHDTRDPNYIKKAQLAFAQEVKRNIAYTVQVCQSLGVDAIFFSKLLQAYEPKTWETVKDHWDETFPAVPLYTSVNLSILNVGEHR